MQRLVVLAASLTVVWLLWSGHFEPMILAFGVLSIALTTWLAARMDRIDGQPLVYPFGFRILAYLPWLGWEIVKANVDVARIILSPSLPISPRLIRVPGTQRTEMGLVTYANSITLTPGTITCDVRDGYLLVHAITAESAAGVETGEMDAKVTALEGGV
jgi:multicomponent Na+:H+ antiporter subunit E